jgi:SAM-dependent methyltransferase
MKAVSFNRLEAGAQSSIISGWVRTPGSCLDLGGGYGRITQAVEPSFTDVLLVDVSRESLVAGRKRLGKADLVQSDANLIPARDSAFDYVIMTDVVHLLPDPAKVFREILRVTKNHGTLILTIPNLQMNALVRQLTRIWPKVAYVQPTFGPAVWPLGTRPYPSPERVVPVSFRLRRKQGTGLLNNAFGKPLSRFRSLRFFDVATSSLWFLKLDVLYNFEVVKGRAGG